MDDVVGMTISIFNDWIIIMLIKCWKVFSIIRKCYSIKMQGVMGSERYNEGKGLYQVGKWGMRRGVRGTDNWEGETAFCFVIGCKMVGIWGHIIC